jgi:DNA replication ATP-dependent helicase Dna2
MNDARVGKLIYTTLLGHKQKLKGPHFFEKLLVLLKFLLDKFIETDKIHFTTFFSKIAYIGTTYKLSRRILYHLHGFRKDAEQGFDSDIDESKTARAIYVIAELTSLYFKIPISDEIKSLYAGKIPEIGGQSKYSGFRSKALGVITSVNLTKKTFSFVESEEGHEIIEVAFNIMDQNENFDRTASFIIKEAKYPVNINLLEIEIDEKGIYYPKSFVLEPDYLIDVTAIAEAFKDFGVYPRLSLLRKFLPVNISHYLMLGNLANHFLDLLISDPEIKFDDLKKEIFQLNPLSFTMFDDPTTKELISKSRFHFQNLKRAIKENIIEAEINTSDIYLEPSFYSRIYGIQGRLDLFHVNKANNRADIIELKSGKAYKPNVYGLSVNHYTQTLLYDLIINSVYDGKVTPSNYILYSSQQENALRFAPSVRAQQREALQLRNELIMIEKTLEDRNKNKGLLAYLHPSRFRKLSGFALSDIETFAKVYSSLCELEKEYFSHFTAFIAKEQHLVKTGDDNSEQRAGLASMWNKTLIEKENQFNIISHLKIKKNSSGLNDPEITFEKTAKTNPLNNFRIGDIGVLYPYNRGQKSALKNQIFKCIVLENTKEKLTVRLRNKQFNQNIFTEDHFWNLEHDLLDSSFNKMYQGLYSFAKAENRQKNLLLSLIPPERVEVQDCNLPDQLTDEQGQIFQEVICAKDYYLLWGPPGTGKTSVMLKHIVKYLQDNSEENLLLLAYTNRAVDEICEAVEQISDTAHSSYIRIGSRYSCNEKYRDRLFERLAEQVANRQQLRQLVHSHRIIISTVASISGKSELFQLKKFDRIIIDEASQILEPNLIGLLSHSKKFILIGDHNQLPAVVVQNEEGTLVSNESLRNLGLVDLRDSLFERLYRQCEKNNWHWAIGRLGRQGRMHKDLMAFPNKHFYDGKLDLITKLGRLEDKQKIFNRDEFSQTLTSNRLIFIPAKLDENGKANKTNENEALVVKHLIHQLIGIWGETNRPWGKSTLGVITPFRAQISKIRDMVGDEILTEKSITIDTVERYQGGARDIIIISFCANNQSQLRTMSSISVSGVDRKLNVALTRAREQIILVGNEKIMNSNPLYKELIQSSYKWEFSTRN